MVPPPFCPPNDVPPSPPRPLPRPLMPIVPPLFIMPAAPPPPPVPVPPRRHCDVSKLQFLAHFSIPVVAAPSVAVSQEAPSGKRSPSHSSSGSIWPLLQESNPPSAL